MQEHNKNTCYRCGKERIISKVWKEKMGNSIIETTEFVCADKKCEATQKKEIRNQRNRRLQMEKRKKNSLRNQRNRSS